jgi:outer membrane protein OmpA-like peptidoglycan-associated protein
MLLRTTISAALVGSLHLHASTASAAELDAEGKPDKKVHFVSSDWRSPPLILDLGLALSSLKLWPGVSTGLGVQISVGLPATPEWGYGGTARARMYWMVRGMSASSKVDDDPFTGLTAVYAEYLKESPPGDTITIDENARHHVGQLTVGLALRHFVEPRYFFDVEGGFAWDALNMSNLGEDIPKPWATGNLTARPAKQLFNTPYFGGNFGVIVLRDSDRFEGITLTGGLRFHRFQSIPDGDVVYQVGFEDVSLPLDGAFIPTAHFSVGLQFGVESFERFEPVPEPEPEPDRQPGLGPVPPAGPPPPTPPTTAEPVKVIVEVERCNFNVNTPILFATNQDQILPESQPVLEAIASALLAHPEIELLEVRGHTDHHGEDGENLDLSIRRVTTVVSGLVERGVSPDRLTLRGYGETKLLYTPPTTEDQDAANRRVELRILKGCEE